MDKLGNITLYNDDCMNLLREFPDRLFDLAIVDPPYFDGPEKLGYYGTTKSSIGVKRPTYEAKHWTVPDTGLRCRRSPPTGQMLVCCPPCRHRD